MNYDDIIKKLKENGITIKENIAIDDNYNTVTSRIDGSMRKRIYGRYLTRLGITTAEYVFLFPCAPIAASSDVFNTSKNSGNHMKLDKYKKMYSDRIKGDKNPNHTTRTTEIERKSRSPFSKEFYINSSDENARTNFTTKLNNIIIHNTSIEYYINKGYDIYKAKILQSTRQTTFTLQKCIEKYGYEKGHEIHKNRQLKWRKSLVKNGNIHNGFSSISQELFNKISDIIGISDSVYYATKNTEYILESDKRIYSFDYTDIENKKIIEYNGDLYHANPSMFNEKDTPNPFRKNQYSKEIWEKDKIKIETAESHGYDVLVVWESDYKADKEGIIMKCISFLKNK